MRRRRVVAAVSALLLVLLALGLRHLDAVPKGRARLPKLPTMVATPDDAHPDGPRPPVVPADPENAVVVCRVDGASATDHQLLALDVTEAADHSMAGAGSIVTAVESGDDVILTLPPGTWHLMWAEALAAPPPDDANGAEAEPGPREPLVGSGGPSAPPHRIGRRIPLGTMTLEAGDVRTCQIPAGGLTVHGRVVNPEGGPVTGAAVLGCGAKDVISGEEGDFTFTVPLSALTFPDGACRILPRWTDGLLRRDGASVAVTAFSVWEPVELEVDPTPIAGMGIGIQWSEDGIAVSFVHPGSPAERTGLQAGDVITTLDGKPTTEMSLNDFVARGTGPVGTNVTLGVTSWDGQAHTYTIRREHLDAPEDTGR